MTTQFEIEEFARKSYERELRRFAAIPVPHSALAPLDYGTQPGRAELIQTPDFEEESHV